MSPLDALDGAAAPERTTDGPAPDPVARGDEPQRFFVHTFGCRCNQADSAAMREALARASLEESAVPERADLLVVNTCTVTHRTDRQVRHLVRKLHRDHPDARLVVTGCYAERDPGAQAAIDGVDLVVGNSDRPRLAAVLSVATRPAPGAPAPIVRTPLEEADPLVGPMARTGGRTRPLLKIQDGCDARCSYCIVPKVRGPARSAPAEAVLGEARRMIASGYRELVVTGVHLGTYGRKSGAPLGLEGLLRRLLEIPGLGRLRLSSIEPMHFSRAIVELARQSAAFAPHFHLPLQSGSDRILRRMRRPYTAAWFAELLDWISGELPDVALGTDVIAGFPGETDADFERTLECIRDSPLAYVHVFAFSAREETDAWRLPHPVPEGVIQARAATLRAAGAEKSFQFRRRFLGRTLLGLTLAAEEEVGERAILTGNYIHVQTPRAAAPPNRLVPVRIDRVEHGATHGMPLVEDGERPKALPVE
jgi:threonylcarbamoyladenosine tRNA methylthiotransferase MtaB